MLVRLWHRQSDGRAQCGLSLGSTGRQMLRADDCTGPEFPLLCTKAVCVFASWAQCVHVMRTFWCLTVFCGALSIYRTDRSPGGTFPCMLLKANTAGPDCICILGLALFSPTHHNSHKKEEQDLQPGRQGRSEEFWHKLIPKWIIQFFIYD